MYTDKNSIQPERKMYDPDISRYRNEFLNDLPKNVENSCLEDLMAEVKSRPLCFVGDFHTLADSQDLFCRLLSHYRYHNPMQKVALGLEFLSPRHQKSIDAYLNHTLSDSQFLKKIGYSWPFDWKDFGAILRLAKKFDFDVFGTYKKASLEERDSFIASTIQKRRKSYSKIFVLLGEFHLCSSHVLKYFPPKEYSCILPNIEHYYPTSLSQFTSIHKHQSTFLLSQTTPWIKWQSYQLWEENLLGADLQESVDYVLDEVCKELGLDALKPDLSRIRFKIPEQVSQTLERDAVIFDETRSIYFLKDKQIRTLIAVVAYTLCANQSLLKKKLCTHILSKKLDPFYTPKTWVEVMTAEDHQYVRDALDSQDFSKLDELDGKYEGMLSSYVASILYENDSSYEDLDFSLIRWINNEMLDTINKINTLY
jgi:mRNA-degrading endonuclease HigB of HigAB toxin-antitoxin module